MPVFSVVMCMTLTDSDGGAKKLLLLVEPSGNPRCWKTFVIKRLRKCEYQECYRMNVVVAECPVFKDMNSNFVPSSTVFFAFFRYAACDLRMSCMDG